MAIRIITDTSADFTPEQAAAANITVVPLPVTIGNTTYDTIDKSLFYDKLINGADFPKTSQPSPQVLCDIFEDAKEAGDAVIAIMLSSGLSGTYQCACLAKELADYSEIYVVDSLSATVAIQILALEAAKLRDNGAAAPEIAAALDELKGRITIYAVMDTLEYLYKGGRLSRSQAQIGNLANLKPVITVTAEGTIKVTDKCIGLGMGSKAVLKKLKQVSLDPAYPAHLLYAYDPANCLTFREKLLTQFPDVELTEPFNIGPVIGTHIGPNALGIVIVKAQEAMEEFLS